MSDDKQETLAADPTKTHLSLALKYTSPFISCRFDPQGKFVFAGAQDNTVQRWRLEDQKPTSLAGHDSWVRAIGFTPDGKTLLTGDYQGRLIWWPAEADEPAPLRTVEAHRGWLRALVVTPDGKQIITCGNDLLIKVWSADDGKLIKELAGHENHIYNLALHPDGAHLASIDLKGILRHWDLAEERQLREFAATDLHKYDTTFKADIGGARGLEFTPDGKLLACGGITNVSNAFAGIGNPAIALVDWEKGEKRLLLRPKENFNASTWGLNFHPSGLLVSVAGGGAGGYLIFYKPEQAEPTFQFKLSNTGRDMHLHADGLRVAVAHHDDHVRIYELRAKPS
jgi:WD40 repeat protein